MMQAMKLEAAEAAEASAELCLTLLTQNHHPFRKCCIDILWTKRCKESILILSVPTSQFWNLTHAGGAVALQIIDPVMYAACAWNYVASNRGMPHKLTIKTTLTPLKSMKIHENPLKSMKPQWTHHEHIIFKQPSTPAIQGPDLGST